MDLLIPDNYLRRFLKTTASVKDFTKYLSLCGPSIERVKNVDGETVYSIEVTSNRVDSASVFGIAREANAILPQFGIKAQLKNYDSSILKKYKLTDKVSYLTTVVDHTLCSRFTAFLIKDVVLQQSPSWVKKFLELSGVRAINNVVDLSNLIMHEMGQPVHAFDYDKLSLASKAGKIANHKMHLRGAKKGEVLITLDDKVHKLESGDIVIEDGKGRLIDLCGIMGGGNSEVDEKTKNVLVFIQTYNPMSIRQTSMRLSLRSEAAVLFEKGLDPEQVTVATARALELFVSITKGKIEKEILDIYPKKHNPNKVSLGSSAIEKVLGVAIDKKTVSKVLTSLGFEVMWKGDKAEVTVPSFRDKDITIEEDLIEEVARIYGYHNLPSELMATTIPVETVKSSFELEEKIKNDLKYLGAVEVYSLSLVSEEETSPKSLRLTNPLGTDSEYLRTNLTSSLIKTAEENKKFAKFHIFEMANVYIPTSGLPNEVLMLAGIMKGTDFRTSKGILEFLLDQNEIDFTSEVSETEGFMSGQCIKVTKGKVELGKYGNLEVGYFYYEFDMPKLIMSARPTKRFEEPPKYPPQIEDITLIIPDKTYLGEVSDVIRSTNQLITNVELKDVFEDAYTFNVQYQHPDKTLTNEEVEKLRNQILAKLKTRFGALPKV